MVQSNHPDSNSETADVNLETSPASRGGVASLPSFLSHLVQRGVHEQKHGASSPAPQSTTGGAHHSSVAGSQGGADTETPDYVAVDQKPSGLVSLSQGVFHIDVPRRSFYGTSLPSVGQSRPFCAVILLKWGLFGAC